MKWRNEGASIYCGIGAQSAGELLQNQYTAADEMMKSRLHAPSCADRNRI